jgi:hypothetical protein
VELTVTFRSVLTTACAAMLITTVGTTLAHAATSPAMQACSAEWKADKAAGTVPAGQTWKQFWSDCAKRQAAATPATPAAGTAPAGTPAAAPAAAAPAAAAPAAAATATPAPAKKAPTAAQTAEHARIKECGSEWKAAKAANQIPANQTWPQYWSACNTRLKAAGG